MQMHMELQVLKLTPAVSSYATFNIQALIDNYLTEQPSSATPN